jgi:predicted dehydrogenase
MALDMTVEQKTLGKENMARTADGLTRRGFMKSMMVAGAAVVPVSTAVYYGYKGLEGKPVRTGLIGGGDEGGVLVGEHNPDFLQFVAVADIRPTNMERIFQGDKKAAIRKGFNKVYGNDASHIKKYTDYKELLKDKDIEAVVIALPLHLHAPVAIEAMRAGKHVLCEKLMAWNIHQCKKMIQVANETNRILSIGHQRHYSMLYAHATEIIDAGILGDIKHIRALWHRNNSWPWVDDSMDPANGNREMNGPLAQGQSVPYYRDSWFNTIHAKDYDVLKDKVSQYGFKSVEELIRWRLYNETGGGLMAELGSHQLDACGIFLGHVHPLAVSAVGGKYFYGPGRNDRDCDDHVFVTYEYPGKNHPQGPARPDGSHGKDESDIVVVTYSSVSTNSFEAYGECVMGTHGTMVVEGEQSVMLYAEKDPSKAMGQPRATSVTVAPTGAGKPVLDTSSSTGGSVAAGGAATGGAPSGPVSRGYREEMEDFACCVRTWDKDHRLPRCHGEVAMADAIVALTANHAMHRRERIVFNPNWFNPGSAEVPDDPKAKPRFDVG